MLSRGRKLAALALVVPLASFLLVGNANAADHNDPPSRSADRAGDIADFYAWHTAADGQLILVLTYAGGVTTTAPVYDDEMLYGIHIDEDGDDIPEHDLWVRFGQNLAGDWGVQIEGHPGLGGPLWGAVETILTDDFNNDIIYAGVREDPFYFDLTGFNAVLANMSPTNDVNTTNDIIDNLTFGDDFEGANVMSIVVSINVSDLGSTNLSTWATSWRLPAM